MLLGPGVLEFTLNALRDALDALIFGADAAAMGSMELADVIALDRRFVSIALTVFVDETER